MLTIFLVLLILAALGGYPFGNPGYDYRYGGGGVSLVLLILLLLFLFGGHAINLR